MCIDNLMSFSTLKTNYILVYQKAIHLSVASYITLVFFFNMYLRLYFIFISILH